MEKPIRIAQIVGKWCGGGVDAIVMAYYRHIDRDKIQFDFFCDEDSTNIPYEEIRKLGGEIILIPPYQKIIDYHIVLKEKLKERSYLIIHSHINTLSFFPLRIAKKVGIPVRIAHSHSTTNKQEWIRNLMKLIMRPFSKIYATTYFCCSELAGRWQFGDKAYSNERVYLLKNAIEVEKFKYDERIRNKHREALNINRETMVVGHVGRFVTAKNHNFLIDTFNEIHKKYNNSLLILIGQGPLLGEVREKVDSLNLNDAVIFGGQRNDVNELYQVFDVFLLPSLYEGLPVVGVEAQTSGLLCIFSMNITKEIDLLRSTKFIDLKESAEIWSGSILKAFFKHERTDKQSEIVKKGLDISIEARKLEQKYLELENR